MSEDAWRLFRIMGEFAIGFDRTAKVAAPAVTVFGRARAAVTDRYDASARALGARWLALASEGAISLNDLRRPRGVATASAALRMTRTPDAVG